MRRIVATVIAAACLFPVALQAEVISFDILERTAAFSGRSFGEVGSYERITARATIALDPADDRNAVITDLALAPVECRTLPSIGTTARSKGIRLAASRTSQSGACSRGTRPARDPSSRRSTLAMSRIDIVSPDTAMKRSPFASGAFIARRCRSATSRTSTTPK